MFLELVETSYIDQPEQQTQQQMTFVHTFCPQQSLFSLHEDVEIDHKLQCYTTGIFLSLQVLKNQYLDSIWGLANIIYDAALQTFPQLSYTNKRAKSLLTLLKGKAIEVH